jgi:geranyl-CoA carboxylase alpha subunit
VPTINKILVANRGEIAVRVIRTARELGYRTVAVYSEADEKSLHVSCADEAVCVGPPPVAQSYLCKESILDAARISGADAVHPGYGFLSENPNFAAACAEAGLTFIGPPPEAIELMGSKRLSKLAMEQAGVPCIPGYQGAQQDEAVLREKAREIGFPLMVKASAGGGGRGMRLVHEEAELGEQLATARSEAENAFGDGELILERALVEPRHIEIQVFADNHGNVIHLGERDCSIQRRHQKVVEEAPSPFVDDELRRRMGEAAVSAARACRYRGAGTVEFLVDAQRDFYFLEMNTRLQVEHPVTELVTGLDLVALQIAVAAGQALPLTQEELRLEGHAIEVRLYAEDPRNQFLPQTGDILAWRYPDLPGIRVDHGIAEGQQVSPFYDPMIAKIIAHGRDRAEAARKLASALQDTVLLGVNNNRLFLERILRKPAFLAGDVTTGFIDQHCHEDLGEPGAGPAPDTIALATALFYSAGSAAQQGWRNPTLAGYHYRLSSEGVECESRLVSDEHSFRVSVADRELSLELRERGERDCLYCRDGLQRRAQFVLSGGRLYLDDGAGHFCFDDVTHAPAVAAAGAGGGQVKAPMDGAIVAVLVSEGENVAQGQTLVVLEAMKMEHQLKAGVSGRVNDLAVAVGDQVSSRQVIATVLEAGKDDG